MDPNAPDFMRAELIAYSPTLVLVDDLLQGPERMWARSSEYIRKWEGENPKTYKWRKVCEPCFGGLTRTLSAGVGMLFAKPPSVVWNASESVLKPLADNIDGAGTRFDVFAKRFMEVALKDGLAVLLTDHPSAPDGVKVTAANESLYNLRPTWALYSRAQCINWHFETIDNKPQPTQLSLVESASKRVGTHGITNVTRIRDLRLDLVDGVRVATWVLREEVKAAAGTVSYVEVGRGTFTNRDGTAATFLPVAIAYTGRVHAPMVADVPLAGVAYANLGHWRYATALTFNREICGYEQMVITGEIQSVAGPNNTTVPGKVQVGPLSMIHLQQDGTAQWIGPTGKGLEQLEKGADEKMMQMDQMGLGFLVPATKVQTTATEARIDSYAQLATLATAGIGGQDALNLAWEHFGWYLGIEKIDCPVLTINTDFESGKMDSGTMLAYVALVNAGYPKRQALEALQDGGRIMEGEDLDQIEAEWEVGLQAAAEVQAADAGPVAPIRGEPKRSFTIARGPDGRAASFAEA